MRPNGTLLSSGLIPAEVIFGHSGFVRAVDQIRLPSERQLFLAAADLARDPEGTWRVLADRTQAPSGAGYAMENRRAISRVLPGLYRDTQIQRVGPFFQAMRLALQQLAPTGAETPRVVLLTPGARTETAFDQAFQSSLLGFPLVEGNDLTVRDGRVWQRSIGNLEPVDVILRRVDAWFCDPLELRPDSRLGVPGLVEAARLGTVSIVNGLGTGVLENAGLFPFLPRIAEVLLDQPLRLPSVATWWCGDELSRRHVLSRMDSLVMKPISRRIARSSTFGWELSAAQREDLVRRIEAEPYAWVGQEPLALSTAPTVGAVGLEARPTLLRTFAVAHRGSYVLFAGGLARVAPTTRAVSVSNIDGAIAKDVWVLAGDNAPGDKAQSHDHLTGDQVAPDAVIAAISPRVAEDLFWLGRYAERAENVARLLGTADNRWRDTHPAADPAIAAALEVLLASLNDLTAGPVSGDTQAQLLSLVGDDARPGTLAHDVRQMRELANAVRDQMSGDTWAVLGRLERGMAPFSHPSAGAANIPSTLAVVLEALLAFAGLAAESMVRDTGWHFMDAGRRVERALQLARLLRSCVVPARSSGVDDLVVESVLTAAESIITHRRRYGAGSGMETVLDLLLFDRNNPRCLTYSLDRISSDLRRISTDGTAAEELAESVLHIGAHLRQADAAALAASPDGRRHQLDDLLKDLIDELHELARSIQQTHFPRGGQLRAMHQDDLEAELEPA
jgi:uncharacterized circularly permuted ATP-grasp superfamily protein/uncharacterized alpha-E superfamily protein